MWIGQLNSFPRDVGRYFPLSRKEDFLIVSRLSNVRDFCKNSRDTNNIALKRIREILSLLLHRIFVAVYLIKIFILYHYTMNRFLLFVFNVFVTACVECEVISNETKRFWRKILKMVIPLIQYTPDHVSLWGSNPQSLTMVNVTNIIGSDREGKWWCSAWYET